MAHWMQGHESSILVSPTAVIGPCHLTKILGQKQPLRYEPPKMTETQNIRNALKLGKLGLLVTMMTGAHHDTVTGVLLKTAMIRMRMKEVVGCKL